MTVDEKLMKAMLDHNIRYCKRNLLIGKLHAAQRNLDRLERQAKIYIGQMPLDLRDKYTQTYDILAQAIQNLRSGIRFDARKITTPLDYDGLVDDHVSDPQSEYGTELYDGKWRW